ncbi:nitrilase family protein [Puniceibacterium sediminis]|uniref:Predicted amidohydrolase n=1 Tax=Puniceibacterium sediminis TaxID=1608407 RepID=A0A238WHY9_9RHOB|nr:nitrilase family protein [Puniceibacterium sediminis]SNR46087.1 Predicted amidohydrolase [Puniceibacterium sediminis]
MTSAEANVTVAAIQMEPVFGQTEHNVARSIAMIETAAAQGAQVVVLPELCNTGYMFQSRAEAAALAEPVPAGTSTQAWIEAARRLGLYIVAGITESQGALLYNSAVIIGPDGYMGTYRKLHLWGDEALYFTPGDLGVPIFDTPLGRLSCHICYDCWFPEVWRLQAMQGAELICVPTNWVPIPGQDPDREAMANIVVMGAAHCNSLFVIAADRVGTERGQPFIGQSLIVSQTGWPVAGPASNIAEELLLATINLADARRKRNWNDFNQPLRDRRTDLYDEMLGSVLPRGMI